MIDLNKINNKTWKLKNKKNKKNNKQIINKKK